MLDEKYISEIVESVVSKMDLCDCCNKQKGVFDTMEEALHIVDVLEKEDFYMIPYGTKIYKILGIDTYYFQC